MITSVSNVRVKQVVAWQTKAKERRKDMVFVVEGFKMFEEAETSLIKEVYISESAFSKYKSNKLDETGYEVVSDEVFKKMSDTISPQGILTVVRRKDYDIESIMKLSDNPLFVLLENIQDPGNLGTIIRTSEGAGVTAVIMSKETADIYNPKVIRSTMGSIYRVPFVYADDLNAVVKNLNERGVNTYAAHLGGKDYYAEYSYKEPTAFLIGNEGNGLTDGIADIAKRKIKIPMEGKVESLNAAVATALLIYEAQKQRR